VHLIDGKIDSDRRSRATIRPPERRRRSGRTTADVGRVE
jgi:hypothetical protein